MLCIQTDSKHHHEDLDDDKWKLRCFFLAILFWLKDNKLIPMINRWIHPNTGIPVQAKIKETGNMVRYSGKRKARKLKLKQSIYTENFAPGNDSVHRLWSSSFLSKQPHIVYG